MVFVKRDSFKDMWREQLAQQKSLGLDPRTMSSVARRGAESDLMLLLHEEVSELQRAATHYKRHILAPETASPGDVADEIADVLKTTLAIAQLYGLDALDVVNAFHRKTNVTYARASQQKMALESSTKVVCVDMDDVICDLAPFRHELARLRAEASSDEASLRASESFKDQWYRAGRFADMRPIDGARNALEIIAQLGYKIVIITARPQWQYKRIYGDTLEWLQLHRIPHDLILFNKDKVEAVFEHVTPAWPVAFVEDHERNARALSAVGIDVLLYDQPHNRDFPETENVNRIDGWQDVLDFLMAKRIGFSEKDE
jgi:uncharacterized HAD superfamily protein/NTP pyrophosphatase (non-canonical NTP hydrolase)